MKNVAVLQLEPTDVNALLVVRDVLGILHHLFAQVFGVERYGLAVRA